MKWLVITYIQDGVGFSNSYEAWFDSYEAAHDFYEHIKFLKGTPFYPSADPPVERIITPRVWTKGEKVDLSKLKKISHR